MQAADTMQDRAIFEGTIVIGAGAAGLVAAHALREAGLAVLLLDKESRVAEPWRRRHKNLHLNTHRDLSALPGRGYPRGTPAFPARAVVIEHMSAFAETLAPVTAFSTEVHEVRFEGDHWAVVAAGGTRLARNVVIATGRDRQPEMPRWPGMESFTGEFRHSAEFGEARDYAGRSVLVIGAGNSGFDALNHLVTERTGALWLSARHAPAVLPKRIGKIAVHRLSPLIALLPLKLADRMIASTQRRAFGNFGKLGFPPPKSGGASRLATDYTAIAADDGAMAAIRDRRIKVVGPVREFSGDRAVLADGTAIAPDVVIAATGYRTGLEAMVGTLGVLDAKGVPLFNGGEGDPKLPGLWFAGMRPSIRGCFANAAIQGRAIAARIKARR